MLLQWSDFLTGVWNDIQAILIIVVGGSIAINWGTIWARIQRIQVRPYVAFIAIIAFMGNLGSDSV